ncbi:hypothetical protein KC19_1G064800 [Ceratodon purpureus]|uniref:Receptor-like serine/threonine-protein kinase n=1 Tax=Ceratodon purpureus TaxID=3225 RepID=A0A8T0J283_CERPU|nr:hypothetical protein KC19_1G064800 [Ceratodon purpureus]KAG0590021.1 hypothetical protein KC19_1G064800 [Ceratodon purpureus]
MGQSHNCYHEVFPPSLPFLVLLVMSISFYSMPRGQAVNVLLSDHFFLSANRYLNISEYYLVMQTDCNLVLYEGARAILATNTSGRGKECGLKMQLDGDLAIYNSTLASDSVLIWESYTPFVPDSFFVLMPNGSLFIYDFVNMKPIASLWETLIPVANAQAPGELANFSYPYSPSLAWKPSTSLDGSPYMPVGYYLDEGCSLQSVAGTFNLTLEYGCNLQSLELLSNGSSRAVWESKTMGFGPENHCRLLLPPDGNLQIQTVGSGKLVWASNVTGNASVNWAVMVDRMNGDVMVRDLLNPGDVLWSTANLPKETYAGGGRKKQFSVTIKFLSGVVGAAFVLAMVAVSSIIYFLRSRAGIAEAEKELQRRLGTNRRKCNTLTPATIKQATRNFERNIGHGGFGDVFYGKLPCGQEIAVKVLSAKSHQSKQEFYNEIELLTGLHHKYLVALIGYSLARNNRYMLVYENLSGGDLRRRLQGDGAAKNPLTWKERMTIIIHIAEAIEYLHNKCSPAVIHRDIKSNNILLTENLVAKVADFGLSKLRASDQEVATHVTTVVKGTPGYLDPDYHESGMLTEKSDVYAFGIVLMEILTGQHHYCLTEKVEEAWSSKQLEDLADPFLKGGYDRDEFQKLVQLSLSCVCKRGSDRPSMAVIVHELQEINHFYNSEQITGHTSPPKDSEDDKDVSHPAAESSSRGFGLKSSSSFSISK